MDNDALCLRRQGCPQDVKSEDRDETETVNLQDRDVPFFKLSRPRQDETFNLQDRDKTKTFQKRIETAVSQFKNTNW